MSNSSSWAKNPLFTQLPSVELSAATILNLPRSMKLSSALSRSLAMLRASGACRQFPTSIFQRMIFCRAVVFLGLIRMPAVTSQDKPAVAINLLPFLALINPKAAVPKAAVLKKAVLKKAVLKAAVLKAAVLKKAVLKKAVLKTGGTEGGGTEGGGTEGGGTEEGGTEGGGTEEGGTEEGGTEEGGTEEGGTEEGGTEEGGTGEGGTGEGAVLEKAVLTRRRYWRRRYGTGEGGTTVLEKAVLEKAVLEKAPPVNSVKSAATPPHLLCGSPRYYIRPSVFSRLDWPPETLSLPGANTLNCSCAPARALPTTETSQHASVLSKR